MTRSLSPLRELPTVSLRREWRLASTTFEAIILVGGMCAGKSTVGHGIASSSALSGRCEVVTRMSRRPARAGDDEDGMVYVPWGDFTRRVASSKFALSWVRPRRDGTAIGYGCLRPGPGRIPIFMAGHGIHSNPISVRPVGVLGRALLIGIFAPSRVRAVRLTIRSPDVTAAGEARVAALMAHDEQAMFDNVDINIDNAGPDPARTIDDAVRAVSCLFDIAAHT